MTGGLRSMSVAALRMPSATATVMSSLRVRWLRSLHCVLAAMTSSMDGRDPCWPAPYLAAVGLCRVNASTPCRDRQRVSAAAGWLPPRCDSGGWTPRSKDQTVSPPGAGPRLSLVSAPHRWEPLGAQADFLLHGLHLRGEALEPDD